ncbi:MAG: carboxypeptidase-like regulatory domain-containing protein, partial [Acidobacteriota bacterium]|nr:carboxypeptidase-like regulatory domain-containing protein [Acidobacteriota bacterium]
MKTASWRFAVLLLSVLAFGFSAAAQTNSSSATTPTDPSDATISGVLLDSTGAGLEGVEVTITAASGSQPGTPLQHVKSDAEGRYSLAVSPGRYHVRFVRVAFAPINTVVELHSGESRSVN